MTAPTEVTAPGSRHSEGFWNSVAAFYGDHNLTNHKSDQEMDYVVEIALQLNLIKELICLGVADGSRDPILILRALQAAELSLPKMQLNDLSPDLLGECRKRITAAIKCDTPPPVTYHACPMGEIPDQSYAHDFNSVTIIGLYNADYLMQSLQGYLESKDVIGQTFSVSCTRWQDNKICKSDQIIEFAIEDYRDHEIKFKNMRDDPNFLAFTIMTDKKFVSHYWDIIGLRKLMEYVFATDLTDVKSIGDRYVVARADHTPYPDEQRKLITSLNNVIGNIPPEYQLVSLERIRKFGSADAGAGAGAETAEESPDA